MEECGIFGHSALPTLETDDVRRQPVSVVSPASSAVMTFLCPQVVLWRQALATAGPDSRPFMVKLANEIVKYHDDLRADHRAVPDIVQVACMSSALADCHILSMSIACMASQVAIMQG